MGRQSDARERLIESAGELWHSRSYGGVGVTEICEHAEVQKGSFYHFFASKQQLALAVIDEYWQRRGGESTQILTGPHPPLDRLARYFAHGMELQLALKESTGATAGCCFGNMVVELATVDPVLRDRLRQLFQDWAELLQRALDDAQATGDIAADVDTEGASRALLAYIEGLGVIIKAEDDPMAVSDLLPFALRLIGADPARLPATVPGL